MEIIEKYRRSEHDKGTYLLKAANFKGSQAEKLLLIFCKQTKLQYYKLTEEEKPWLVRISHKSKLMKSIVKQRGKKKRK